MRYLLLPACIALVSEVQGLAQSGAPSIAELIAGANETSRLQDWPAAVRNWRAVTAANPFDGAYWNQLALAEHGAGQCDAAVAPTDRAVELGYGLASIVYFRQATCYVSASEDSKALAFLRRAVDAGYETPENIMRNPAWSRLRSNKQFLDIIGQPDVAGLDRLRGWTIDLDIMEREILRKAFQVRRTITPADVRVEVRNIKASVARSSDIEIFVQIAKLFRRIDDGHTGVSWGRRAEWAESLPLLFEIFEDGVHVIAADPAHKELVGAQVLELDGRPISTAIAVVESVLNRDNEMGLKARVPYYLRRTHLLHALGALKGPRTAELTIRDSAGARRRLTLAVDASQPEIWNTLPYPANWVGVSTEASLPLYRRKPATPYWFEHVADQRLVYFGFNLLRTDRAEPLDRFSERMFAFIEQNQVERLVIDLRWNNGGDNRIFGALLDGLRRSRLNKRGSLFVIIGRRTYSAAQNFATQVERSTSAIFVGEPTGSSPNFIGEEDEITLPYSKLIVNVSDAYYQNSTPMDKRKWIAPFLVAQPSFADYRAGRDRAMVEIERYIKGGR